MDDDRLDCTGEDEVIDMLQQKMAQITVLKANILRTAACFKVLSSAVQRQIQNDLELWRSSLPVYMRLEALVQSPTISPDQRRVTFYMHLFYMSALILKARALLATQGEIVTCSRDSEAASVIDADSEAESVTDAVSEGTESVVVGSARMLERPSVASPMMEEVMLLLRTSTQI